MKVTDMLVCHHDTLRGVFHEVERAMEVAESVEAIVALAAILAGLTRHHAEAETQMLFVPLDALLREKGHTGHFFSRHEEYGDMLERVGRPSPGQSTRALLMAAISTLRHHLDVEEQVVIPMAEKTFAPESLEQLGGAWLQRNRNSVALAVR